MDVHETYLHGETFWKENCYLHMFLLISIFNIQFIKEIAECPLKFGNKTTQKDRINLLECILGSYGEQCLPF